MEEGTEPSALTPSSWFACLQINIDNETSPSYTMLTLRCEDRKGLLYDLFRTMKDIDLRWVRAGRRHRQGRQGGGPECGAL